MIVKASQSNLQQILELNSKIIIFMKKCGFSHWSNHYPTEAIYRRDIMRGSQYIYLIDNIVRGIVSFDILHHEYFDKIEWNNSNESSYYVHRLAVDPEFHGRGIANDLMNFSESIARKEKIDSIRLGAFKGYRKVVEFYKKRDYKVRGEILFDVSDTTFYGMEKTL